MICKDLFITQDIPDIPAPPSLGGWMENTSRIRLVAMHTIHRPVGCTCQLRLWNPLGSTTLVNNWILVLVFRQEGSLAKDSRDRLVMVGLDA